MAEKKTDYSGFYPKVLDATNDPDPEPETVDDLPEDEEAKVEEIIEEAVEDVIELIDETPTTKYLRANIDDGGKLRVRSEPDGDVLLTISNKPRLRVLDDKNPNWTYVEFEDAGDLIKGYIKKSFLVEA